MLLFENMQNMLLFENMQTKTGTYRSTYQESMKHKVVSCLETER